MRGNEPVPVHPDQPAERFPIPMRGNEQHLERKVRMLEAEFPIPMRGNEQIAAGTGHLGGVGFPIP